LDISKSRRCVAWAGAVNTSDETWQYARADGTQTPGDDASWTALDTFRADNTEYFAGPGHSETGWVA